MQTSERSHLIIPNIFPAKLWHLVNQSDVTAIVWDSKGEGIKVHQELLEKQILSPNTNTLTCCNNFRGITFSSFIRQLYAYGFKKAEHCKRYQTEVHYYFHPHFNKNKPELLSLMYRSAPKYRRTAPFFPERETLPEKGNEKVVSHSRSDNPAEANMHRGKSDLQRCTMILKHCHKNCYRIFCVIFINSLWNRKSGHRLQMGYFSSLCRKQFASLSF